MRILVFDNYDSFTYNLVQYLEEITGVRPDVARNDEISLEEVGQYDKILLSPGPGLPAESGILCEVIETWAPQKSILGVCLGLQAMAEVYGGKLLNMERVFHGVASQIRVLDEAEPLFRGLPPVFEAGRYHSWVVAPDGIPDCFRLTCVDEEGTVMGLTHKSYDLRGVQFHPESVMTPQGKEMLRNWVGT